METPMNVDAALNILQRTPVESIEENLNACSLLLLPEEVEDLFQRVDCPLKEAVDVRTDGSGTLGANNTAAKKYILSDHNRDGDSYRSPWSNDYYPPVENTSAFRPSRQLRQLEELANEVFDSYRQQYYGKDIDGSCSSISSVYLWNKEGGSLVEGFAGCFMIKKDISEGSIEDMTTSSSNSDAFLQKGYWNSIHVVDVNILSGGKAKYELSTTVILSLELDRLHTDNKMNTKIGGSLTKQVEKIIQCPNESSHITNIGQMIETAEIELRSNMDALYIQKTREVIDSIRSGTSRQHSMKAAQNEMNAALMARFKKK